MPRRPRRVVTLLYQKKIPKTWDALKKIITSGTLGEDIHPTLNEHDCADSVIQKKAQKQFGIEEEDATYPIVFRKVGRNAVEMFKGNIGELTELLAFAAGNANVVAARVRKSVKAMAAGLTLFSASWCGHCKLLKPVWLDVVRALEESKIQVAHFEIGDDPAKDPKHVKEAMAHFKIQGYPTIKWVKANGESIQYEGVRTVQALVAFAKKHKDE